MGRMDPPAAIATGTRKAPGSPGRGCPGTRQGALGSLPVQFRQPGSRTQAAWGQAPAGRDARSFSSPATETRAFQPHDAPSLRQANGDRSPSPSSAAQPRQRGSPPHPPRSLAVPPPARAPARRRRRARGPMCRSQDDSIEPGTKTLPTSGCRARCSFHAPSKDSQPRASIPAASLPIGTQIQSHPTSPHRRCSYSRAGRRRGFPWQPRLHAAISAAP